MLFKQRLSNYPSCMVERQLSAVRLPRETKNRHRDKRAVRFETSADAVRSTKSNFEKIIMCGCAADKE
jgi:hypothetical protein